MSIARIININDNIAAYLCQSGDIIRPLSKEKQIQVINNEFVYNGYFVKVNQSNEYQTYVYILENSSIINTITIPGRIYNIKVSVDNISYNDFMPNTDMVGKYISFKQQSYGSFMSLQYAAALPPATIDIKDLSNISLEANPTHIYPLHNNVCKVTASAFDKNTNSNKNIELYVNDSLASSVYGGGVKELDASLFALDTNVLKVLAEDGAILVKNIYKEPSYRTISQRTFLDYDGGFSINNIQKPETGNTKIKSSGSTSNSMTGSGSLNIDKSTKKLSIT